MIKYFLNKYLKPKDVKTGTKIKYRLSVVYAILGWNCAFLGFYMIINQKLPTDPVARREKLARALSFGETVHMVRLEGLTTVEHYTLSESKDENQSNNEMYER